MLTTLLDISGLVLLVAAAYLAAGPAAALVVAGGCCLWSSWSITKAASRSKR